MRNELEIQSSAGRVKNVDVLLTIDATERIVLRVRA